MQCLHFQQALRLASHYVEDVSLIGWLLLSRTGPNLLRVTISTVLSVVDSNKCSGLYFEFKGAFEN